MKAAACSAGPRTGADCGPSCPGNTLPAGAREVRRELPNRPAPLLPPEVLILAVEDFGVGDRVAPAVELVEGPDDALRGRVDLHEQGLALAGVAVADHVVAVRQDLDGRHPRQHDVRQVLL